ncbi:MAG: WYL domain-containing protein, partial [Oscillospiraceae bacterium]|nr:WYL domain-containing protein [Oscillospiraceae bacterium]
LTLLQRRWLKAISLDPRMKLFEDEMTGLEDVEPLFTQEDFYVFYKYSDGDPYENADYIRNFRRILDAIRNKYPLELTTASRNGREVHLVVMPERLEYSEKDDKFRLIGSGRKGGDTINLGRIIVIITFARALF